MIGQDTLKNLLKSYGINTDKLLDKNQNVIDYGYYNEIKMVLDYLIKEKHIPVSNVEKSPSVLFFNPNYVKENYDQRFLKPLIINKDHKHLERCFELLKNKGVLDVVIDSASILSLKYDDIRTRIMYLEEKGIDIIDGNKFNSIFGMNKTRMMKKFGVTQDDLNERYANSMTPRQ